MSGPSELAVLTGVLADAGWKATVVIGLGWLGSRLGRSAAQRHAVWAVSLGVLPVLLWLSASRGSAVALDAPWMLALWGLGFVGAWVPLLRGLSGLRRLGATAVPDEQGILTSDAVTSPLTWGLWRPVVVLPSSARSWSTARRRLALAHEEAHVRRRDWAVHLAAWVVCTVFWFHPLVWWARRAMAREAEHAADDAVLAEGVRPSDYAELLLSLSHGPVGAALGAGSFVGQRVHGVLGARDRSPRRGAAVLVALVVAALALPNLGAWAAWSTPDDELTCQPGLLP